MKKGIIFWKKINGSVVDRTTILYYLLKMENLKAQGKWNTIIDNGYYEQEGQYEQRKNN